MPPPLPFSTTNERRATLVAIAVGWLVILAYLVMLLANLIGALRNGASGNLLGRIFSFAGLGVDQPWLEAYALTNVLALVVLFSLATRALLRTAATITPAPATEMLPVPAPEAVAPPTIAPATQPEPTSTATPRVFISHSSGDNTFGNDLVARLRAAGCDVWYDSQGRPDAHTGEWSGGLYAGDSWQNQIVTELTERKVFVVVLTEKAVASKWVQDEIQLAWSEKNSADVTKGKVIVPVLRETCDIPTLLTLVQYVDYRPEADQAKAWANLLHAVRLDHTIPMPTSTVGPPFDLAVLPPLEHFVGREDDVAWVIEQLTRPAEGDGQLASIAAANGLAGIGKTALATEVAWRLWRANAFPDGIAVVVCKDQRNPLAVLRSVLARFTPGRVEPKDDDLAKLGDVARKLLANKRALVILDNVEDNWPVGQVLTTLRAAGAAVLLTSRALLPAVPLEASRMLELLPLDEALDVFAEYLGRGKALDLTRPELDAATSIVTSLGRHTLAVKLGAAQAATLNRPLATVAAELEANPDRALLLANGEEAVRYLLDSSYAALQDARQPADAPPSGAQRLFIALAAFATADIGRQAVLDVADSLGIAEEETALGRLIALRLVDAGANAALPSQSDCERLRVHPLVQTYARSLLRAWSDKDQQVAQRAVTEWYAAYAREHAEELGVLSADEANMAGAFMWTPRSATADDATSAAITSAIDAGIEALYNYLNVGGRWRLGLDLLELQLKIRRTINDRRGEQRTLNRLGTLAMDVGQMAEAQGYFEQGLAITREIGDRLGEGAILGNLGLLAKRLSQSDEAERKYKQALDILQEGGDQLRVGNVLNNLGLLCAEQGRIDEAIHYYEQALTVRRQVNDRRGEGHTLGNLGLLFGNLGQTEKARAYYEEALAIQRALGERSKEGATLNNLGTLAYFLGQLHEAVEHFEQALVLAREVSDRHSEALTLGNLGEMAILQGRLEEAAAYLKRALNIARTIGDRREEGRIRANLGTLARDAGNPEEAAHYYQEALGIARDAHDRSSEGDVLDNLGLLASLSNHLDEAELCHNQALTIQREVRDQHGQATTLTNLANLAMELGRLEEAVQYHKEALTLEQAVGNLPRQADTLNNLGELAQSLGQMEDAWRYYEQALALFIQIGAIDSARIVRNKLDGLSAS
jgi:tetratricopeptide (TPR) repeat protein